MRYLEILKELPPFARDFINHLSVRNKSENTLRSYTYELRTFFGYLCQENPKFPDTPKTITLEMIEQLIVEDLEEFLSYSRNERQNNERSRAKKQATIKSLFAYLFKRDKITKNIASKLDSIKISKTIPKALEHDEAQQLDDVLRDGSGLTLTQSRYFNYTHKRDYAIFVTLLNTGIRLFELCELNLSDVLFIQRQIRFIGKGGNEYAIPLNSQTIDAIRDYIDNERPRYAKKALGSEDALFLSIQGRRISHRAVQDLVKKYMAILESMGYKTKGFSPHKMRSTVATWLLEETGDIKRVKDFLRHEHISTTEIYIKTKQEELRQTAKLLEFGKK